MPIETDAVPGETGAPAALESDSDITSAFAANRDRARTTDNDTQRGAAPAAPPEPDANGVYTDDEHETNPDAATDPEEHDSAIDAPAGWTDEDKAWFAELPPERQKAVARRELALRQSESRRANEHRKALEAIDGTKGTLTQREQRAIAALDHLIPALQTQIQGKFGKFFSPNGVPTPEGVKYAHEAPAEYQALKAEFDAHVGQLSTAWQQQQTLLRQKGEEQETAAKKARTDEHQKLATDAKLSKYFGSEEKAAETYGAIGKYLEKSLTAAGISAEAAVGRIRNVYEKPIVEMALKAMWWDEAEAKRAKAAKEAAGKPAPRVQRPGAGGSDDRATASVDAAMFKLKANPGNDRAIASAFRAKREAQAKAAAASKRR